MKLVEFIAQQDVVLSKSEARELIQEGRRVYVNGMVVSDPKYVIHKGDRIDFAVYRCALFDGDHS